MHHKGEEGVSQHSPGGKPDGRWSCYWSCCQSLSLGMRVRAQAGLGKGAAVSLAPRTCSPHSVHLCSGQPQDTQSFSTSWPTPGHPRTVACATTSLWPWSQLASIPRQPRPPAPPPCPELSEPVPPTPTPAGEETYLGEKGVQRPAGAWDPQNSHFLMEALASRKGW